MSNNKNVLAFKSPPLLNKESILNFGQYKNNSVSEVMKYDASYLVYLAEKEIVRFEAWLPDDIHELVNEQDDWEDEGPSLDDIYSIY